MAIEKENKKVSGNTTGGLDVESNILNAISYLFSFGVIIPLLIYFLDKRRDVRLEAIQAAALGVAGWVVIALISILSLISVAIPFIRSIIVVCLYPLAFLVIAVLDVYYAYIAYSKKTHIEIPVISNLVKQHIH